EEQAGQLTEAVAIFRTARGPATAEVVSLPTPARAPRNAATPRPAPAIRRTAAAAVVANEADWQEF
ncbi:hypothetical protein SB773_30095, partial [Bacillus sp. SIMBA_074]|uniref:hypothetical protein n=1 Tax=Bacillus sp. SIMBA_074 TaxID=3085812 RepID=UPI003978CDF9